MSFAKSIKVYIKNSVKNYEKFSLKHNLNFIFFQSESYLVINKLPSPCEDLLEFS